MLYFSSQLFLFLSLLHHQLFTRCQNFDRLSFHYLVTGNRGHLSKMLKIAQHRKNRMSRYHNALYLGDIEERVRVLEEVGQVSQQQNKNNYIDYEIFGGGAWLFPVSFCCAIVSTLKSV